MRLQEEIQALIGAETSPFRAQLLREDLQRLQRLQGLALQCADRAQYLDAGSRLGWTQADARTAELRGALDPLMQAVYEYEHGERGVEAEQRLREAWLRLTSERVERLVGCLTTRPPKPDA